MAKKKDQGLLPAQPCDGVLTDHLGVVRKDQRCDRLVRQTRPSKSGRHYCSNKACQAVRVREYQQARRRAEAEVEVAVEVLFVRDLLHGERIQCPRCGLTDALPEWAHPTPDGSGCGGTFAGGQPTRITPGRFATVAWSAQVSTWAPPAPTLTPPPPTGQPVAERPPF